LCGNCVDTLPSDLGGRQCAKAAPICGGWQKENSEDSAKIEKFDETLPQL